MPEIKLVRDDLEEQEEKTITVEKETTVSQLLETENINREEVLVSRNQKIISEEHVLKDGDTITIRDVIAGG